MNCFKVDDGHPLRELDGDRGGEVEGRTFREWFIDEYMVTNETLLHRDPKTGARPASTRPLRVVRHRGGTGRWPGHPRGGPAPRPAPRPLC